jgi:hypothetical protein
MSSLKKIARTGQYLFTPWLCFATEMVNISEDNYFVDFKRFSIRTCDVKINKFTKIQHTQCFYSITPNLFMTDISYAKTSS